MRLKGIDVVAGWGGLESLLWFIHLDYGGGFVPSFPFSIQGGMVALVELIALAAVWTSRRRSSVHWFSPAPRSSRIALWAAMTAGFAVIALVYRPYFAIPGVYPAIGVLLEIASARRRRAEAEEEQSERRAAAQDGGVPGAEPANWARLAGFAAVSAAAAGIASRRRGRSGAAGRR